jgi:hypothetical protein
VPSGFVSKHFSECAPTCVEDGFSHPRFRKGRCIHISNDYKFIFTSYFCGLLVQVMLSRIRNFGVDSSDAMLVVGSLSDTERFLVPAIVLQRRDFVAIVARRQGFKAKIDANLAVSCREIIFYFTLKSNIPSTTSILAKCASFKLPINLSRLPKAISLFEINNGRPFDFQRSWDEGKPPKRSFWSATGAEFGAFAFGVAGCGELTTNCGDSVGVQSKFLSRASAKLDQINGSRPTGFAAAFPPSLSFALSMNTEVPNEIHSPTMRKEPLATRFVFNSELKSEHHGKRINANS